MYVITDNIAMLLSAFVVWKVLAHRYVTVQRKLFVDGFFTIRPLL